MEGMTLEIHVDIFTFLYRRYSHSSPLQQHDHLQNTDGYKKRKSNRNRQTSLSHPSNLAGSAISVAMRKRYRLVPRPCVRHRRVIRRPRPRLTESRHLLRTRLLPHLLRVVLDVLSGRLGVVVGRWSHLPLLLVPILCRVRVGFTGSRRAFLGFEEVETCAIVQTVSDVDANRCTQRGSMSLTHDGGRERRRVVTIRDDFD